MSRTLIVVAQRAKARLFEQGASGEPLAEIRDLVHPESRAHGTDLETDRPGRVHDRHGPGRHAMAQEEPAKEREAANFAREVVAAIEERRTGDGFGRLILVAEPGFLGLLRGSLPDAAAKVVDGELPKELTEEPVAALHERLREAELLR